VTLTASGTDARLQPPVPALLTEPAADGDLTPRTVQAAFTASLARRLGLAIAWRSDAPGEVVLEVLR
jgi:hypothetical protein